jgi:hypothetical protein
VLLLQRPASLLAATVLSNFSGPVASYEQSESLEALEDCSKLLTSVMNSHTALWSPTTKMSPSFCLAFLTAISGNVSNGGISMLSVSWKIDLLELGLHRWFSSCQAQIGSQLSIMTLFHLTFVNIRTNMELVHKFARWQACPPEVGNSYLPELQEWQGSDDCKVSTFHAKQLVDTVKQSVVFKLQPRSGTNTPSSLSEHSNRHKLAEAPHLANSVYMATLVLWTAAVARKKADWVLGRAVLENGILVLACFEVRVATKLGNALRCLNNSFQG